MLEKKSLGPARNLTLVIQLIAYHHDWAFLSLIMLYGQVHFQQTARHYIFKTTAGRTSNPAFITIFTRT
jgi:hypothetical protein